MTRSGEKMSLRVSDLAIDAAGDDGDDGDDGGCTNSASLTRDCLKPSPVSGAVLYGIYHLRRGPIMMHAIAVYHEYRTMVHTCLSGLP